MLTNHDRVPLQNHRVTFQKITSPKLKMLGPLCYQIDKIYSFVNHNENEKKCVWLNNRHKKSQRNHMNRIFYKNILRSIDLSILASYEMQCHELLCVFGDCYASGTQDAEVTKLKLWLTFFRTVGQTRNETLLGVFSQTVQDSPME